ncbi:putative WD repeat-containing protein [Pseudocercospora fuligena]|uniref:Putative WD repeat-containing protein n=1 Tax=Pseudocercospora fuligena TaxID=685502 RepID=A0A8H6VMA9_9PEZI|nr:putative WD repeat-containing protein [Pseudocercospora fuligena]
MAKLVGSTAVGGTEYLFSLARADSALATITSDDQLHVIDAASLKTLKSTKSCHTGVSCLKSGVHSSFVTGGRDGLIRCWDSRAKKVAEVVEPQSRGISSIACHDRYIAAGTESTKEGLGDVSVLLFDTRNSSVPLRQYNESHTDSITQLQFHPVQPQILLSGSTDGLVSIFDVNHADEEDALQQVLNPRSAVHCAGFLAQDQAYVVSTDEQYSIHTLAKTAAEDEEVPPPITLGDVREKLDCMYVIDVLVQPDGPPVMAYGHNEKQTLAISSLGSPGAWAFGEKANLPGAHGEEVVRDLLLVGKRAFSCGEDGNLKAWVLG